jgi:hypothetical protein
MQSQRFSDSRQPTGLSQTLAALMLPIRKKIAAGWLGRQDSNLGMAESKSAALPLGYAPTSLAGVSSPGPEGGSLYRLSPEPATTMAGGS